MSDAKLLPLGAVPQSHALLRAVIRPGDVVVDATCGTGGDTAMLADRVGPGGVVWAIDVQPEAIARTRDRLTAAQSRSVRLHHGSHVDLAAVLPAAHQGAVRAVVFNLGYLPGSDSTLITAAAETPRALEAAYAALMPGGRLVVVVYPGHAGGDDEARVVEQWFAALPRSTAPRSWRALNLPAAAPYVLAVDKPG